MHWILFFMSSMVVVMSTAVKSSEATDGWYPPGYFEPQEAIYLLATSETSALPSRFGEADAGFPRTPTEVQARIAEALNDHVNVRVLVQPGTSQQNDFLKELQKIAPGKAFANVSFHTVSHCDIWTRDVGPIWLKNRDTGDVKMVKPVFSLWGYDVAPGHVNGSWAHCDVPNHVPDQLSKLFEIPFDEVNFVTEGGDKSFNSRGSVIMNQAVETQRNPGLTLEQIEDAAKAALKVTHVVWTKRGVVDDEQSFRGSIVNGSKVYTAIGTGGHVDEFCRFAGPSKVLLAQVSEAQRHRSAIAEETYQRLEQNAAFLAEQTDQDGNPLEIVRIPVPEDLFLPVDRRDGVFQLLKQLPELALEEDETDASIILATSYVNYIIANGVVVVPEYWKPGRSEEIRALDSQAKSVLRKVFPGRTVVGVNNEPVSAGGGGLNCISNNQPRRGL
eukprot:g524.t1